MNYENEIVKLIQESIEVKEKLKASLKKEIAESAALIIRAFRDGRQLLVCGNGGSAADSQHFVAELVGRFEMERKPLPAIALTVNTSILTAWSNDYSYDTVFSRQVEALGRKGDILFAISTSGNASSVIEAMKKAKEMGLVTIALTGKEGGEMKAWADCSLIVQDKATPHIQEAHITIIHILCSLIEKELFTR
ncbi:MAG: D-sedoheptulose 7-phosphate isomerase [bacterium]|nr:D-sedoheptulose 7-phosphate isomerase [bacterium]